MWNKRILISLLVLVSLVGTAVIPYGRRMAPFVGEGPVAVRVEGVGRFAQLARDLVHLERGVWEGASHGVLFEVIDYEKGIEDLAVKLRLKRYDLTGEEPRLLGERIIHWHHPLPEADQLIDYATLPLEDYLHTPQAVAHYRLAKEMQQTLSI